MQDVEDMSQVGLCLRWAPALATGTEEGSGALATAQLHSWEGGWCLPLQSDFPAVAILGEMASLAKDIPRRGLEHHDKLMLSIRRIGSPAPIRASGWGFFQREQWDPSSPQSIFGKHVGSNIWLNYHYITWTSLIR